MTHSGKKNNHMREQLTMFVNKFNNDKNVMKEISKLFNDGASNYNLIDTIDTELTTINKNWDFINKTYEFHKRHIRRRSSRTQKSEKAG